MLVIAADQIAGGLLGADERRALEAALKYFREAAPKHIADEEEDLFPMLRRSPSPHVVADTERLEAEHKTAEAWHREVEEICERWLRTNLLSPDEKTHLRRLLRSLSDLYRTHIRTEEERVFPAALNELSDFDLQIVGRHMASRRGVLYIPEQAVLNHLA